ncbi:hypothetical protein COCC4DRAFT_42114 [Bipolaris maydis ATCC 48331]|uniref:Uncharacterized protein n=1 Tax=Cochliobolus heterostrophus (strain C4 / ATCC 48331 / race T) TaxID=665024 RepID=N4X911_COCH4|nr:uncharacterized protein COCC4DRAFT_42114 [Bipolaris maydis ATCC 48331]ENI03011.1 hypothetical protein COCC4DRAFT_42114 [Bipolaris maydis ATCC 48331]
MCQERCAHPHDGFDDPLANPEPSIRKGTQEDSDEEALNDVDAEWGELSQELPNRNGGNVDSWDLLGRRAEDNVDYTKSGLSVGTRNIGSVTSYKQVEIKQRLLWDTFVDHFKGVSDNEPLRRQLLLHVDDKADTTVIMSMCAKVERIASDLGIASVVIRAAPTGVAACNFGGSTLHSLLRLLVKEKVHQALSPGNLRTLQEMFRSLQYSIIDEKSMGPLRKSTWI